MGGHMNEYELGTTVRLETEFKDLNGDPINPTTVALIVIRPDGVTDTVSIINNTDIGDYNGNYTSSVEGDHTYTWTGDTPGIGFTDIKSNFFVVVDYSKTDVDHLIPVLRFYLGDYDTRRYLTDTLRDALIFGVRMLMRQWASRYTVDDDGTITRSTAIGFDSAAPPVIQYKDGPPIVIQAAMLIKSGSLQDSSWQIASWRDDEIAVSNIQADKSRRDSLKHDEALLKEYFKRRLHAGSRQELPGFVYPPNYREG